MIIRKATEADLDAIEKIYDDIHTAEERGEVTIGWDRAIYPVRKTAEAALKRGDLFVLEDSKIPGEGRISETGEPLEESDILGTGIINNVQVDSYEKASWEYDVPDEKVCVLHTMVISPAVGRRGYGKKFVKYYEDYAKTNGFPELRLDTNARNKRAREMYKKLGYKEVGIVPTVFNGIEGVDLVLLEKYLG
ncbi:MAG: GNAT family N-acetyltransferase [Lachnospiraceae bacterium]|nr:GNAT family N-acetyltransferase [Lachnospiraceae bacterium]